MRFSTILLLATIPLILIIGGLVLYQNYDYRPTAIGLPWKEEKIDNLNLKFINHPINKKWLDTGKFVPSNYKVAVGCGDQPCELELKGKVHKAKLDPETHNFYIVEWVIDEKLPGMTQVSEEGAKIFVRLSDESARDVHMVRFGLIPFTREDNEIIAEIRAEQQLRRERTFMVIWTVFILAIISLVWFLNRRYWSD